jgi:thiamine biosynthesis protein ThiS
VITITINGKPYQLSKNMSLTSCLDELEFSVPSNFVAIAHNGSVVESSEWKIIQVQANDRIDIVRPIGGG